MSAFHHRKKNEVGQRLRRGVVHCCRALACFAAILFCLAVPILSAQDQNPLVNDPKASKPGEFQFRSNYAFCPGLGARGGGRGPHLTRAQKRHGNSDIIDRCTGKLLHSDPYAKTTWRNSKDAEGRPISLKEVSPTPEGSRVCPGAAGATNWMSPTYDPQAKLFYVTAREQCDSFRLCLALNAL
jgi:hypothetical protein